MRSTTALKDAIARFRRLVADDGQDLLEYALLCALIALVAYAAVSSVGQTIYTVFWKSIGEISV
jgi:Flp pilus assembly pilin Flp